MDPTDAQSGLGDALADLMHFARRYGLDWDRAVDLATAHHADESRYDWDEVQP